MNPAPEIQRLLDIMPASGRMLTKIISKPEQSKVIDSPFPLPWKQIRPIYINFDLWRQLSKPQRDMLLLRTVSWLIGVKWFKADLYQGIAIAAMLGTMTEVVQLDAIGIVIGGGLSALAISQIWRNNYNFKSELAADEAAIQVAKRRGYNETESAEYLLSAIETVAKIEGRMGLDFTELIRCQNLRSIAGISPIGVPEAIRRE